MFVGGTVALPFSSVTLLSVLLDLSVKITVISLTGLSSLSVIVAVMRLLMSIRLPSGSITFICPSPIVTKAFSIGLISSVITTL